MNSLDDDQTPTPIIASNTVDSSSQSRQLDNLQDDQTGFYKGMTFKNKDELATSLYIAGLNFFLTK